jgi:hypothetical protein
MEERLFSLKPLELRRLAFEFSVRKNILRPFDDGAGDKDSYQGLSNGILETG